MWYWILGGFVCLPIVVLRLLSWWAAAPQNLGAVGGQLARCPSSPNCVTSQCQGPGGSSQCLEAIPWAGTPEESLRRIKAVLAATPRTRIVSEQPGYLRCEVQSRLFGFVDDVEFVIDSEAGLIHFRSASRVGYSDLGANRQRMELFRRRFSEAGVE